MADGQHIDAKTCTKCETELPATLEHFGRHPRGKFGLQSRCRTCQRAIVLEYCRSPNGRAKARAWREAHREQFDAYQKQWAGENRERIQAAERRRRESPEYLAQKRAYEAEWKRRKRADPEWLARSKRIVAEWLSRPEVRERLRSYRGRYIRERMAYDADFRCKFLMGAGVRRDLKRGVTSPRAKWWEKHCGYSLIDLRSHLERQFHSGMSWENHGTMWDIDHIKPLSAFITLRFDAAEFRVAWALNNLRPLAKKANRAKHARPAEECGPPAPLA